jgi:chromosome segregation ATPase
VRKADAEAKDRCDRRRERDGPLKRLQDEVVNAHRRFEAFMPREVREGYRFIKQTAPPGILGLVVEVIDVPEDCVQAVGVVAKARLLHMVARTQGDVDRSVAELRRHQAGRLTFQPLDRVQRGGRVEGALAFRITSEQPELEPLVTSLFGKVALVKTLSGSSRGIDQVTPDGDLQSSRGPVTGGSKAKGGIAGVFADFRKAEERLRQATEEARGVEAEGSEAKKRADRAKEELRRAKEAQNKADEVVTRLRFNVRELEAQIERDQAKKEELTVQLGNAKQVEASARAEAEAAANTTTAIDRDALTGRREKLVRDMVTRRTAILEGEREIESCNSKKDAAERELRNVDIARAESILKDRQCDVEVLREGLQQLKAAEDEMRAAVEILVAERAQAGKSLRVLERGLEKAKAAEAERRRQHSNANQRLEKLREKKTPPPESILDQEVEQALAGLSEADLRAKQIDTETWIQGHHDVNLRAHAQLDLARSAVEAHAAQVRELRVTHTKIEGVIVKCVEDRDRAITDTFRQINEGFQEILQELDRGARGNLEMTEEGVSLRCAFGGQKTTPLAQLSGGQKTLLSLTLIFAIQRALPAPFYLFDEVDAALDDKYRDAVARLINRYASGPNGAQVILTTFKPELLVGSDLILEVSAKDGRSTVRKTKEKDALALLATAPIRLPAQEEPEEELGSDGSETESEELDAASE